MNEQPLSVERQLTLLRMAARVDPHLRQAVVDVEAYIDALRTENAELRAALNQQGHIAEFREDGWSLEHPLECRATGLIDCPVNRACGYEQSPPALGRFHVVIDEEGFLVILRASTPEGSQEE